MTLRKVLAAAAGLVGAAVMTGGVLVAPAEAAPAPGVVPTADASEIAQVQRLVDEINATRRPDSPRAVNALARDVATRPLGPIRDTVGVGPLQRGFWPAFVYGQFHPEVAPPGANDFSCKPKAGQNPVVLVHGTWENA